MRSGTMTKEALVAMGAKAHAAASALTLFDRAALLESASAAWDHTTVVTLYYGGKKETRDGETVRFGWAEFGAALAEYSTGVFAKGEGAWFTPAVSTNGRCRDVDIDCVTQLALDADGVGDWYVLRDVLNGAALAHLVQRSSSDLPFRRKWHLHVPLARPFVVTKREWRAIYRHSVGWFSAAANLQHNLHKKPPLYGFDLATDRLGQPWFPSARRTIDGRVPESICVDGNALDLDKFLDATEFRIPVAEEAHVPRPHRGRGAVAPATREEKGLLLHAFAAADMLGPYIGGGKHAVICPWSVEHTTGAPFDGSTIIFGPSSRGGAGWFFCSHAHCVGRSNRDVLAALPAQAVGAALRQITVDQAQTIKPIRGSR